MQQYIGVKIIKAEPQVCQKDIHNSKAGDPGYLVEYEDGYRSWSPAEVFVSAYRQTIGMTFGLAIEAMKKRHKVARSGWNGKGMWIVIIPSGNAMFKGFDMQDCIGMKTANDVMQPGWLASQNDILAEDWMIVE